MLTMTPSKPPAVLVAGNEGPGVTTYSPGGNPYAHFVGTLGSATTVTEVRFWKTVAVTGAKIAVMLFNGPSLQYQTREASDPFDIAAGAGFQTVPVSLAAQAQDIVVLWLPGGAPASLAATTGSYVLASCPSMPGVFNYNAPQYRTGTLAAAAYA